MVASSSLGSRLLLFRACLNYSNVCRLRIIKTPTEQGRPGTEARQAGWVCQTVHIIIMMSLVL